MPNTPYLTLEEYIEEASWEFLIYHQKLFFQHPYFYTEFLKQDKDLIKKLLMPCSILKIFKLHRDMSELFMEKMIRSVLYPVYEKGCGESGRVRE